MLTAFRRYYLLKNKLSDRMIKQLLNSVIAKYRDLSVPRRSVICLSLRLRQVIDLLTTDKSRYFVQPHPIIANCLFSAQWYFQYGHCLHQESFLCYSSSAIIKIKMSTAFQSTQMQGNEVNVANVYNIIMTFTYGIIYVLNLLPPNFESN